MTVLPKRGAPSLLAMRPPNLTQLPLKHAQPTDKWRGVRTSVQSQDIRIIALLRLRMLLRANEMFFFFV